MLGEKSCELELTKNEFGVQRMEQRFLDLFNGDALLAPITDRLVNRLAHDAVRTLSYDADARELTRRHFKLTLCLPCLARTLLLGAAIAAGVAAAVSK